MSWIDDIGQDNFFKGMAKAMKGEEVGPAPGGLTSKDIETAKKSLKNLTDQIKETSTGTRLFKNSLDGNIQPLVDISEQLKEFDEAIRLATTDEEVRSIQERKAAAIRAQTNANLRLTAANLATGFVKVTGTLIRGSLDYAKNLLSGMDGILAAGELAANRAKAAGEGISMIGQMLSGAAGLAGLLPPVRLLRLGFIALTAILGPLMEKFGEKAAELAQEGIKLLSEQLANTRNSFQKLSSTGVLFANGMGEMRAAAGKAGLGMKEFEEAIANSTPELASMGMGLSQATKRIGAVSGELRKGDLGKQLYKLGFGFKEQAELAAQTAASLNASGRLRSMSDAEVAKVTAQYGKDLKILQGITGEDAKKKMEEARLKSMEADLLAQAYDKGGPAAVEKLQKQLAAMPEAAKKGYMEFVSTGGTAITDVATNVMMTQNPKLMEMYQGMYKTLGDSSKTASDAQQETIDLTAATAKYARENNKAYQAIATGARLTGDGLLQSLTDIQNGFILANQTYTEESAKTTKEITEKAKNTMDPLTESIHSLDKATMAHKVQLEALVTSYLPSFARHLEATLTPMSKFIEMLGAAIEKLKGDLTSSAGASIDAKNRSTMHGADRMISHLAEGIETVTGFIPVIGKDLQKKQQEERRAKETAYAKEKEARIKQNEANRAKMTTGEKVQSVSAGVVEELLATIPLIGTLLADKAEAARIENETAALKKSQSERNKKGFFDMFGFSRGGISDKPAIFGEKGPEAAVPLPDGRTIPVKLSGLDKFFQATMKSLDPTGMISDKNIRMSPAIKQQYESLFSSLAPQVDQSKSSIAMASRVTGDTLMSSAAKVDIEEKKTHRNDIKYLLESQIAKQDQMIKYLKDTVEINLRILTAAQ